MMDELTQNWIDMATLAFVIGVLSIYHLYLFARTRNNPLYTVQGLNRAARTAWVKFVMAQESRHILAIQTLRNSNMAATFMASTAILLIIGTLNLSGQSDKLTGTWQTINYLGSNSPVIWMLKIVLLVTDFFVAFFSFAMSIRLYNHVGFQLSVDANNQANVMNADDVAIHVNRAGYYYSAGMRSYYISVPLVFWLFGPIFMLVATAALIAVLFNIDRNPQRKANVVKES